MASLRLLLTITVLTVIASVQGQADGDLRLVSSSGTVGNTSGRLEVYYSSQWGTVCDDGFGPTEALVACQQLGFSHSQIISDVPNSLNGAKIWLDELSCVGSENRLADCNHNPFGSHNCYHLEDIGLTCSDQATTPSPAIPSPATTSPATTSPAITSPATTSPATTSPAITSQAITSPLITSPVINSLKLSGSTTFESEGNLRLVGKDGHNGQSGRVEVFLDSEWGTVCANNVRKVEANIVCQQLGFSESVYFGVVSDLGYGTVSSSISVLLSGLVCNGDEDRLEQCQTNRLSSSNCSHSNDLAVVCQKVSMTSSQATPTGSLRLNTQGLSESYDYSGRLEVFLNGQWGTVCDDGFSSTEAYTACRQLGYFGALHYGNAEFIDAEAASRDVPIWLDDVWCSPLSSSQRLVDCFSSGVGRHNCNHGEDVALVCLGVGSLRLVGSSGWTSINQNYGRLEIYVRGEWGTVCDNMFGKVDGDVACRQMGFPYIISYGNVEISRTSDNMPIWLNNVECGVDSTFLLECDHLGIGITNCGHSQDVQLICATHDSSSIPAVFVIGIFITVALGITMTAALPVLGFYIAKRKRASTNATRTPTAVIVPPTTYAVPQHHTGAAYPTQSNLTGLPFQPYLGQYPAPQQDNPTIQGYPYTMPQPQQHEYSMQQQPFADLPGQLQSTYPIPGQVKCDDPPPAYTHTMGTATELNCANNNNPPSNSSGYPQ